MRQIILVMFVTLISFIPSFAQEGCFSDYDIYVDGWSILLYQNQSPQLVSGISGTELIVFGYVDPNCEDFDAGVHSTLKNVSTGQVLSSGSLTSNSYFIEGEHDIFNANSGDTYCLNSDHGYVYWWATAWGWNSQAYRIVYGQVCYTFPPPPTPTPTPPCFTCQDIQATIGAIEIIEKYNVINIPITVSNATDNGNNLTTTFSLQTNAGTTGSATFEDGSTSVAFQGDVMNQNLRIKGVIESSQVNNIIIEAKFTNSSNVTRVLASDRFTVAVISSLVFEANNSPLDANPGTDGIVNPDGSEGQRIYPDKDNPTDTTDRQSVKVIASVLPATLNANVYFATYDLDDPSISAVIDTNGATGNDNNGSVTNGTNAGLFSGANCTVTTNRAECPNSNGTSETLLTVTMQPGDNFAVAASLTEVYRNGINLDINNGARLLDSSNNELPTARASGNEVVGIRTQMLTVWRKLHIEVDSMGKAKENYVRGNMSGASTIAAGATRTVNVTAPNLETNRFENGRLELAWITNYFDVVSNTNNTVTIKNTTSNSIVIDSGVNFQILNQGSTRSGLGTIPNGQTIAPGDSVTININSRVPLETNLFANGSLFITPTLNSLTIISNTATSLQVKNNSRRRISIEDATFFRLYDDDDMNDDAPPILGGGKTVDGDEGDDVPEPDMSLLQNSDLPANNVFAPAYIRPQCCLTGSRENVQFSANLTDANIVSLYSNFNNIQHEANPDFWTIYVLGGYQWVENADSDPIINPLTGQGNGFVFGKVDNLNGIGVTMFTELNRATEFDSIDNFNRWRSSNTLPWRSRPVSKAFILAHEVGHLFYGEHEDQGVMSSSQDRTIGVFSDTTLNKIRGGEFTSSSNGQTLRITHP